MKLRAVASPTTALVLAAALMLTGCGGEEKQQEKTIEKAIKDSSGEDVDVSVDDEKVTMESSDGTVVMNGGERPESIPEDFPIIDGEIATSLDSPDGAMVSIKVDDPVAAFEEAVAQLEEAGYTQDSVTDAGSNQMAMFSGQDIESAIVMTVVDEGQLTYTVSVKD